MMQREPHVAPALGNFGRDAIEGFDRQRLVGLVLQISDAPSGVVVAHQTQKRHHRPIRPPGGAGGHGRGDALELERLATDGQKGNHQFSIRGSAEVRLQPDLLSQK